MFEEKYWGYLGMIGEHFGGHCRAKGGLMSVALARLPSVGLTGDLDFLAFAIASLLPIIPGFSACGLSAGTQVHNSARHRHS